MNRIRCLPLLLALAAFALLLVGCGNKGDLVRPSDVPEAPASA
jgi:predicted small lipoprotein YifL